MLVDAHGRAPTKVETFQLSIEFLVAVVIGGAATVVGPLIGGFVVVFLQHQIDESRSLSDLFSDPNRAKLLSPAIFGIALILSRCTCCPTASSAARDAGSAASGGRRGPASHRRR